MKLCATLGMHLDGAVYPDPLAGRQALAELSERARRALLEKGLVSEARRLSGALIGTVNSVCGALLGRFAFEAGLSPDLRVLDEKEAPVVLAEAMADALTPERLDRASALGQSIFAFRGADPALMQAVVRKVGLAEVLKQCRRSRPDLVRFVPAAFLRAFEPEVPADQVESEPERVDPPNAPASIRFWGLRTKTDPEDPSAIAAGLIQWLRDLAAGEHDEQAEGIGESAVTVSTLHKAKGLEWPVVVLATLNKKPRDRLWQVAVRSNRTHPRQPAESGPSAIPSEAWSRPGRRRARSGGRR